MLTQYVVAAVLSLGAGKAQPADHRHHQDQQTDSTTATVENDLDQPITVYLEVGNEEIKLGNVPAEADSTFTLPRWLVGVAPRQMDFYVHPTKGLDQDTGPVDMRQGEHLGIEVKHN